MIGIIAACSLNSVIGITGDDGMGKLPFHYPDDMRHFRETTRDSTIIMGRRTFESIGSKPLPKRNNFVVTSQNLQIPNVTCTTSVPKALAKAHALSNKNIWLIGGTSIYEEGMLYADEIHLTLTPDYISENNVIKFPFINPIMFELCGYKQLSDPPSNKLVCAIYKRTKQNYYYEKTIQEVCAHKLK